MEPTFNTWTIIFLVASLQGLLLTVALWKNHSEQYRLVAGIVLSFSLMLLFYVSYWTHYLTLFPRWIGILQGLTYVTGPLFLAFINNKTFQHIKWHFVPATLFVVYFFLWPFVPVHHQKLLLTIQMVLQTFHLLVYGYMSVKHAVRQNSKPLVLIATLYGVYGLTFLAYYLLVWTGLLREEYDYLISLASCGCIYFIGYSSFHLAPELDKQAAKYDKSGLSETAANAILKDIKKYMEQEKGYLNSELKLHQLSEELSISANHISQVINALEGCNFTEFVNHYRIEEAKKLILDDSNTYKIIQIAYLSGFNNKATFNAAFKKFVGMQPSKFKKSHAIT